MICTKCKKDLPSSQFYKDKQKKSGFRPRCKICEKEYVNKEARRIYEKKYWSGDRAEKRKAIIKKSQEKNKDKIKEQRKQYLKTDAGIAMHRRQTQTFYAKKHNCFVEVVCPFELFKDQDGACYLCNKNFDFSDMELDHIIPISKGGMHKKSNCKMACATCNKQKGSKILSGGDL